MESILPVVITLAVLAFLVWLCIVLPYKMAGKRKRNKFVWVLVSILVSPLVAIIALLAMGDAEDKTDLSETFA